MKELEDFLILLGKNFSRINFANLDHSTFEEISKRLPKNSADILKRAKTEDDHFYAELLVLVLFRFGFNAWMKYLTPKNLEFFLGLGKNTEVTSESGPDDPKFYKQLNSLEMCGSWENESKDIGEDYLNAMGNLSDSNSLISRHKTLFVSFSDGDADQYNPVCVWPYKQRRDILSIFIPSKRVYNNIKKFLVTEGKMALAEENIGKISPEGVAFLDLKKMENADFNPDYRIVWFKGNSGKADENIFNLEKWVEGKLLGKEEGPKTLKHKTSRGALDEKLASTDSDLDRGIFLTEPMLKRRKIDLDPIEIQAIADETRTQGSDEKGCLRAATAIINDYLSDYWDELSVDEENPQLLPPRGLQSQAHCVIDVWGKEKPGEQISRNIQASFVQVNKRHAKEAFDYINACLDLEIPVLVGLNYCVNRVSNNDGVTDHFSIIYGRRYNPRKELVFLMYDVGNGKTVRLYTHNDTYMIESYNSLKNKRYQLTQIRIYDFNIYDDGKFKTFESLTGATNQMTANRLPRAKKLPMA